jgi:hypothetical protein
MGEDCHGRAGLQKHLQNIFRTLTNLSIAASENPKTKINSKLKNNSSLDMFFFKNFKFKCTKKT